MPSLPPLTASGMAPHDPHKFLEPSEPQRKQKPTWLQNNSYADLMARAQQQHQSQSQAKACEIDHAPYVSNGKATRQERIEAEKAQERQLKIMREDPAAIEAEAPSMKQVLNEFHRRYPTEVRGLTLRGFTVLITGLGDLEEMGFKFPAGMIDCWITWCRHYDFDDEFDPEEYLEWHRETENNRYTDFDDTQPNILNKRLVKKLTRQARGLSLVAIGATAPSKARWPNVRETPRNHHSTDNDKHRRAMKRKADEMRDDSDDEEMKQSNKRNQKRWKDTSEARCESLLSKADEVADVDSCMTDDSNVIKRLSGLSFI